MDGLAISGYGQLTNGLSSHNEARNWQLCPFKIVPHTCIPIVGMDRKGVLIQQNIYLENRDGILLPTEL